MSRRSPQSQQTAHHGRLLTLVAIAMAAALATFAMTSPAIGAVTQPSQPTAGPGGSATPFNGLRTITGGSGNDAWEILTPSDPTPQTAPLVVVMHGYYEFSGYTVNGAIARHTAQQGNVVIYPRWQTSVASPCAGPYDIAPCVTSAATAIHDAISYLHAHPTLTQPRLNQTSYFGFSFGGIVTANMTNEYRSLHLPKPQAIWLDDPHDGGLTGANEPALDPSLSGIPATTKIVCHDGADGILSLTDSAGESLGANGGCNAVFPKIAQIPAANKSIVLTTTDTHGQPALSSAHGVCAGPGAPATDPPIGAYSVDAYDWGFCWRSFDALRACALSHVDCSYALGNTPENRYIGTWSDGIPIIALKIQTTAPISATPVPAPQAKPRTRSADRPPHTTIRAAGAKNALTHSIVLHGTAAGPNGVAFVEVAVVRRASAGCRQMTRAGTFIQMPSCTRPSSFGFATGASNWSLKLPPRLPGGSYRLYARAIDSFGQTPPAYPRASTETLTVK